MKLKLTIATTIMAACFNLHAEEMCLISIKTNGTIVNYPIVDIQSVTINTDGTPNFVVNRKNKSSEGGGKVIIFGKAEPTSVNQVGLPPLNVNIYSDMHIIYVDTEKECDIMFLNTAGQLLDQCKKTSHCECAISTPGLYIISTGEQQFKILVK